MSKFKVRDKVKVYTNDRSASVTGTVVNQSHYREKNMEYAVDAPNFSDVIFVAESQLEKIEEEK